MENFKVPVVRTAHQFLEITVAAESREQAEAFALEQAGDHEFPGEKSAEYSIEGKKKPMSPYLEAAALAFCSGGTPMAEYQKLLEASEAGHGEDESAAYALIWNPLASHSVDDVIHYIEDLADAIKGILNAS